MTIQDDVRGFIVETFFVADPAELTEDLSLIDSGIVDSTGMLDVILFIEEHFGITLDAHEADKENFNTINLITALVQAKTGQRR